MNYVNYGCIVEEINRLYDGYRSGYNYNMEELGRKLNTANLRLKTEAIELAKAGQISHALPLLHAYLKLYPSDVEVMAWQAACLPPADALEVLEQIMELDHDAPYLEAWWAACARQANSVKPTSYNNANSDAAADLPEKADKKPQLNAPQMVEVKASVTEAADASSDILEPQPENEGDGPISLSMLIPGFEALSDTSVIIPPPPPPAPPQVEPLPLLDATDWLARASSDARRSPEFTSEFNQQLSSFIGELNQLKWPEHKSEQIEDVAQRAFYNRGIELARSGEGKPERLQEAIEIFGQCRPPLGFAGLAETLVSASFVRENLYHPVGLVYAIFWADRALALDAFNIDALVARSEATARSDWRLLADITLGRLRLLAPDHPRRYAAEGWYEFRQGDKRRAAELLELARAKAITPAERRYAARLLEQVQPPVSQQ